jgi:hypothetical protein
MPREGDSQRTQREDPADPHGTAPAGRAEDVPAAWLDNPRNVQAFFDAIERARKAKDRDRLP